MKTPLYCLSPPFSNFLQPPPYCLISLSGWVTMHIWCVVLPNDIMDLQVSTIGNLVPEGPCCVFYGNKSSSLLRSDTRYGFLLVLWFDITHTNNDTKDPQGPIRLTHSCKYILASLVMYSQQLSVLHRLNNSLISKLYFTEFQNAFAFQNLLTCRSHISVE